MRLSVASYLAQQKSLGDIACLFFLWSMIKDIISIILHHIISKKIIKTRCFRKIIKNSLVIIIFYIFRNILK
jgi:hypothetical protein